jgi:outer membrane lipoprotein-sorting protein
MRKFFLLLTVALNSMLLVEAQDMTGLISQVKAKLDQVNDYVAEGTLKTNVTFIKAPAGKVKIYFKKPDHFKLQKEGGISILPKGGVSISVNSMIITTSYVALAAGQSTIDGVETKIVKLLPTDENSDIVLSTLYIDEKNLLIRKAITTTKENGTYEINMSYGRYGNYGLPDKVVFSFNTKDYKLPKGVTLEFDEGEKSPDAEKLKNKKGKIEITYNSYSINKGVDDKVFGQ